MTRLRQGVVLPQRTRSERESYADAMAAMRRWGAYRGFEGRLERLLGKDCLDAVLRSSLGVHKCVPVYGLPAYVRDGALVPRFSGGGFASLSDLISEATSGGKAQRFRVVKTGATAPAVGASQPLWASASLPAAGGNAAAAPGGTIPINTAIGALGQTDPTGGDTLHFVSAQPASTVAGAILMYDYTFGVNIAETATSTAVTGVPTRYQSADAAGSWISARITTVHVATAGNYTITYMDQAGNAVEAAAAVAKRTSGAVQTIPLNAPQWNIALNSPDTGARKITIVALSAAGASGATDWFIGHSIVTMPCPLANIVVPVDGINSAFNLVEVKTGAALAFMEYLKSATTAATVMIEDLTLVSG